MVQGVQKKEQKQNFGVIFITTLWLFEMTLTVALQQPIIIPTQIHLQITIPTILLEHIVHYEIIP